MDVRFDVSGGRATLTNDGGTALVDVSYRGGGSATVTNSKVVVNDANGVKIFGPIAIDRIALREVGSESFSVPTTAQFQSKINAVLARNSKVVTASSEYDIEDFVKVDTTTAKTEDTQFVHNDSITNGGAVILENQSAKVGVEANYLEFDSTGSYGDFELRITSSASQADRAMHVYGSALSSVPQIEFEGDVEFSERVILTSPNGTKYYLQVANDGTLSTTAV